MTVLSALGMLNYGLVLAFGLFLSVDIAGGCETMRQKHFVVALCPLFLLAQVVLWLILGFEAVERLYPLIVHIPLMLSLIFALKKPVGVAIVSVSTGYLCCELPNWLRMIAADVSGSPLVGEITYTVLIVPIFFLLQRFFAHAAYETMTLSKTALMLFGSLPLAFYAVDYATTIYSDALYAGIRAINESLLAVFVVFYVIFLTAYHVQMQQRGQAEMQSSMLEAKWTQAQTEMDALRRSQTQAALYQHDMRHHLNMIEGYLDAGKSEQAAGYIRKVQADVEAITPKRFCENETVNLLCSAFAAKAKRIGVRLGVAAKLPSELPIADTDLCALLSNGLENALRAAAGLDEPYRHVELYCAVRLGKLLIEIKNPYHGRILLQNGVPVSNREGHGFGCRSMQAIAARYGGLCEFSMENDIFQLQLVLPVKNVSAVQQDRMEHA